MKKQFEQPWAIMYKAHRRNIVTASPGTLTDEYDETKPTLVGTRLGTYGAAPVYGDDYE